MQRLSKFTKSFNRILSFNSTRPKPHACLATDQDQAFERPRRWSQYGGQFWFTVQWQKAGTEMTPIEVWTVNKTPGEHRPSRVVDCSRPKKADHHGPNTQTEKAARGRRFRARRDRNVRDFLAGSAKVTSRRVSGLANGSRERLWHERASQSAGC